MSTDVARVESGSARASGLCRALEPLYNTAIKLGIDTTWSTEMLGMPIETAISKNLRLPWSQFIGILKEFGDRLEPHGGWDAMHRIIGNSEFNPIARGLGLFVSPSILYRIIWTWIGPTWFPHLISTFEQLDETSFRFTLKIPEPYAFDRGYFEVTRIMLWEMPTLSGMDPAQVQLEVAGRHATYLVQTREPRTIRARLKRYFGRGISDRLSEKFSRDQERLLDGFATLEAQQARLERSHRHHVTALDRTGAAVVQLNLDSGEQFATPKVFELFGQTLADPRGVFQIWTDQTIDEHRLRIAEALESAQTTEVCIVLETQLVDGRWLRARINRAGTAFSGLIVATWVDVSKVHSAEAKARKSLQKLERVFSVAPFAVVVHSKSEILFQNDAFGRLPPNTLERLIEHQKSALTVNENEVLEVPAPHREIDLQLRVHSTSIGWEGRAATLATIEDITIEREMVARSMVMDRMAATGTHAAGIAHEINNPLAYIQSNLQYAMETLDSSQHPDATELDAALSDAALGVERVREVVASLKDFSRKSEGAVVETDMHEVVNRALNIAWAELRSRAELVTRYDIDRPALAEPITLSQTLVALFQNAAQAIPAGRRGRIDVVVTSEAGDAVLRVIDDGEGIDRDVLPRIFDPFFTTRAPGNGAGLGLSLARSRIERMDGSLHVRSEHGQGTTVEIRLPLASDPSYNPTN